MSRALILTNYKRPFNLQKLFDIAMSPGIFDEVFLIDNSGRITRDHVNSLRHGPFKMIQPRANLGAGFRFEIASGLKHDQILCLDDDIFPNANQIAALFDRHAQGPSRMHGVFGQTVAFVKGTLQFKGGIQRQNVAVHIMNRIYAFTPALAVRALEIAKTIGYQDWRTVGPIDDIMMSFAGDKIPLVHDLGRLADCPSEADPRIATWKQGGFGDARRAFILQILKNNLVPWLELQSSS